MSFVVRTKILKSELVLLATAGLSVTRATQGSDLAQAGVSPDNGQMGTNTSKPWDTSWYNKYNSVFQSNSLYKDFSCFKPNPSDRDLCPGITLVLPWINR